ncbi:GntR family transcriptional regulator [Mesorhizobium sp.]|uniref:GntR family transcriptional regulator n=1 Tax=Mesorhizobium sp. TaxID=1871066 RepID=UPI00122271C1|nr:GntR family transcriptional regulator [Mesorhizobium sp.]TIL49591.1 MAG: GntR family transcriptional regulator [Mesorhizobium sp.]TIL84804.1 MAG: GntR family transcriptional regulator [Mesorhizobium sp.]TIR28206.1 MAG: GntR family transcriptional regulator [Mesorhizobium sp.]
MVKIVNINKDAGNLAERAYDEIKRRIFDFVLMPGDRLSESDLAQQIEVSRTPLRQALQRLQHEGFVEALPKVGWLIVPLDFEKFDELYDFRILIECFAARELCATRKDWPELRSLALIWKVPAAERLQDAIKTSALDEAFHRTIVESTGNREMMRTHREITERIRIIRRLDFTKDNRVTATYDEHAEILAALQGGRSDEAQQLLTSHIEISKREVRQITLDMLQRARKREPLAGQN